MLDFENKEDYNFDEYLYDNGLIKSLVEVNHAEIIALWPAEGANYVKYCKDNDFYFEKLGDF